MTHMTLPTPDCIAMCRTTYKRIIPWYVTLLGWIAAHTYNGVIHGSHQVCWGDNQIIQTWLWSFWQLLDIRYVLSTSKQLSSWVVGWWIPYTQPSTHLWPYAAPGTCLDLLSTYTHNVHDMCHFWGVLQPQMVLGFRYGSQVGWGDPISDDQKKCLIHVDNI
jgi:hypothetical protein